MTAVYCQDCESVSVFHAKAGACYEITLVLLKVHT